MMSAKPGLLSCPNCPRKFVVSKTREKDLTDELLKHQEQTKHFQYPDEKTGLMHPYDMRQLIAAVLSSVSS